jgi:hypothetical protein
MEEHKLQILFEWAETYHRLGLASGRKLTESEVAYALDSGVKAPESVRVLEVPIMPSPPIQLLELSKQFLDISKAAGLTLGNVIIVLKSEVSQRLMRHELRHVHQTEACGSMEKFLREYVRQIFSEGYENADFEIDARKYELEPKSWR